MIMLPYYWQVLEDATKHPISVGPTITTTAIDVLLERHYIALLKAQRKDGEARYDITALGLKSLKRHTKNPGLSRLYPAETRHRVSDPVVQLSLDGFEVIAVHPSAAAAARAANVSRERIRQALSSNTHQAGAYLWRYEK